jgi:hypothetical protein
VPFHSSSSMASFADCSAAEAEAWSRVESIVANYGG